ncbi:MAG: phosphate signaling complex protein PhoU [Gammaproteobacteria bacterium]|jgi:phosphate transport system protein|nr:phosphate signaling complex protein PhoU [Gammaproteobacteria bacterium]MBT4493388.1 phosphate signaling complex protein PhoU [Gammaproteobacteria bacterium]MBT7369109.1 phosphate signaling complex protein PhoU [Gammaproteobacteria bacterium]
MSKHLEKDLVRLSDRISELGSLVVDSTVKCMVMLQNFDQMIADEILRTEDHINKTEVDIEEECLKVLALHQPVAGDLRFLIVVLKVNNDLERMGDQVVNIAERIKFLADKERVVADLDFTSMGEISSKMVNQAVSSLVRRDSASAREVLAMDDELDALHARSYRVLQEAMKQNPEIVTSAVSYLTISANLERLGDLATNIAEDIIFMEEGEVIRHQDGLPLG